MRVKIGFMTKNANKKGRSNLANVLLPQGSRVRTKAIHFAAPGSLERDLAALTREQRAWLHDTGWQPDKGNIALLPSFDGVMDGAVLGLGRITDKAEMAFLVGQLARQLPAGAYHFHQDPPAAELAAIAWLLGGYQYAVYSDQHTRAVRHLRLPEGVDKDNVLRVANGVVLARDLINTPPNDLGPAELADAARHLAESHGAEFRCIVGDDLLRESFPLVHAVGRASDRAPRLIELRWGEAHHPKVTLVGKGICFDTGGLNIKTGNHMALMKKDMGGAASVLALGMMIMAAALPVSLRILIPAADNNVAGNAFRPSDVIASRKGLTVEIGNTDAEGRLVLADALAYADEEAPELMICMATLTGAARVALGTDLPPYYVDNDDMAAELYRLATEVHDPLWRMPFYMPYDGQLASKIADLNHIADHSFAGSIIGALFLKRFVKKARDFLYLDIYAWVANDRPARPKGGEPQGARALFELVKARYPRKTGDHV
jgi:leucyl aminopeptidase